MARIPSRPAARAAFESTEESDMNLNSTDASTDIQQAAGTTTRSGAALAALAGAQFMVMLATSIVNVALPQIRAGVGLSDAGTTWAVNAYGLAFGALLLAGGRASDLLGRRLMLLAGLAVFAASTLGAGLATSSGVLIAARAVQGLGAAAIAPAALALVMGLFPSGPGRGRALGVWGAVSGAGGAAGVLLGGALTQALGWRWIFFAVAIGTVFVATAVAGLVASPVSGRSESGRFDVPGALTVSLALTGLVWGLTTARSVGWGNREVLVVFGLAALLLAAFVLVERHHPDPLIPPRLFGTGRVAVGNVLMTLLGSIWIALFFFLPLYQQQVLGESPLVTGLGQLPLAGCMMLGSALAPRLAIRIGATATAVTGLLVVAAGMLWLAFITATGSYPANVLGPSILIGLGLSTAFVQLTAFSVDGVPGSDAGLAGGLVNTTRQVGGAVGLAVLSTLAGSATTRAAAHHSHAQALTSGYRLAFAVSAALMAATAVSAAVLTRPSKAKS